MKYAALCATVKDEDVYLKEWLAYHAHIGFEHFILYDNCSENPVEELLKGFADTSMVTIYRHKEPTDQWRSYNHCITTFKHTFKWIAFIDVDEFINVQCTDDIRVFLGEYEQYAAVALTWRMFSSNGHETTPTQPVIQAYTRYTTDDTHIKSIIQPALTQKTESPHSFIYSKGSYCVDSHRMPIPSGLPFALPQTDKAYIHHYYFKSRQCFAAKIARGNPCNLERKMEQFDLHLEEKTKRDKHMVSHISAVESLLEKGLSSPRIPYILEKVTKELNTGYLLLVEADRLLQNNETHLAKLCICYASLYLSDSITDESRVWSLRAKAAFLESRLEEAKMYAEYALTLFNNAEAYIVLLEVLTKQGNLEEAKKLLLVLKAYEKLVEKNKN